MEAKHTTGPTRRACFIRREMNKFRQQASFNRTHYSEAEAFCWDAAAADCLQALGGLASDWQRATDDRAAIKSATGQ